MFFSKREKIILISIIGLIILIPITSFVIAYRFRAQTESQASTNRGFDLTKGPVTKESTSSSSLDNLLGENLSNLTNSSPNPTAELSFGPTLNFQVKIEGRPVADQSSKQMFVGIAQGEVSQNPQYLLSFKVDLPTSGVYTGLSLAGLNQNTTYTAYLKGRSQIATSSSFTVTPTTSNLGILNMLTGDLNEDNVINSQDLTVAASAYNSTPTSSNWNPFADFNLDNIINNFDVRYIYQNNSKIGAGGAWYSRPSGTTTASSATSSAQPIGSTGSATFIPPTPGSSSGYWMWIPSF